jgi:hypothetical protein|tara:strand:- start:471 stop:803 length:333 start_codon:yes stop_codon:yes gene_type:complete
MLDKEFVLIENQVLKNRSSPEQTLYLSVLLQALLDATKPAYKGEPDTAILERDRATAWFFASVGVTAEDFNIICDYADIDPSYMKEFAFKVLKSGEIEYVRKRINAVLSH